VREFGGGKKQRERRKKNQEHERGAKEMMGGRIRHIDTNITMSQARGKRAVMSEKGEEGAREVRAKSPREGGAIAGWGEQVAPESCQEQGKDVGSCVLGTKNRAEKGSRTNGARTAAGELSGGGMLGVGVKIFSWLKVLVIRWDFGGSPVGSGFCVWGGRL